LLGALGLLATAFLALLRNTPEAVGPVGLGLIHQEPCLAALVALAAAVLVETLLLVRHTQEQTELLTEGAAQVAAARMWCLLKLAALVAVAVQAL
jgi:hypothetical protein